MGGSGGIYGGGFEAYQTVADDEYRSVLNSGLVVLDANVLLDLYRYHIGTRNDLIEILVSIKDRLWVPYQAMGEFWQGRSAVIDGRSKEIDNIVNGILGNGSRLDQGIRAWANRVGLPQEKASEILRNIESVIADTTSAIRNLSADDALSDSADTSHDPVLAVLESLLDGRIGDPLAVDVAREVKKEALQRIADKRAPGWKDASKKANKEGDYTVWYQTLQEAKSRGVDVLFMTDDVKEDWWRIEHGQAKGPLPELVREMRAVADVRLLMTRPETLLLHARYVLGRDVSHESVRDVQRVSGQVDIRPGAGERVQAIGRAYELRVSAAITELGYLVSNLAFDEGMDILIAAVGVSRMIGADLKYYSRPLPKNVVDAAIAKAGRSLFPVLLIANVELSKSALAAVKESKNLVVVQWRDESDTHQLATVLNKIFSAPSSS